MKKDITKRLQVRINLTKEHLQIVINTKVKIGILKGMLMMTVSGILIILINKKIVSITIKVIKKMTARIRNLIRKRMEILYKMEAVGKMMLKKRRRKRRRRDKNNKNNKQI